RGLVKINRPEIIALRRFPIRFFDQSGIPRRHHPVAPAEEHQDRKQRCQNVKAGVVSVHFSWSTSLIVHLRDRKSTRLNSSHVKISYAVFCLKKKSKASLLSARCWRRGRRTIPP